MAADYQYFGWRFEEGKETCHVWKEAINEELIIWKRLSHRTLELVCPGGLEANAWSAVWMPNMWIVKQKYSKEKCTINIAMKSCSLRIMVLFRLNKLLLLTFVQFK